MAKKKVDSRFVVYDWKEADRAEHWTHALKALGLYVYELPSYDGTDTFGFIVSKKKLTKKQVEEKDGLYNSQFE